MNLRVGENSIRFRINLEELEQLLIGQSLQEEIPFGAHRWRFSVSGSAEGPALEWQDSQLRLCIPDHWPQELRNRGRDRHGLSFRHHGQQVSLQVDIRSQSSRDD